jgi:hypothetical protein
MSLRKSFGGLSILAGAGALEPLPVEMLAALERVEVVAALGERGSFRLCFRLAPGSTLPALFLRGSGDLVRVVLSLREGDADDGRRVAMDGVMVTHSVSAAGVAAGLVIDGEDLTLLMDLVDNSGRPFAGMAIRARVALILAAYSLRGVTPLVVPPPLPDLPNPSERVFHQQGTDDAYLRALARQAGYRFTLDPGPEPGSSVAYWGPEPRGDRAHPSLTIHFGQPGSVESLQLRFDQMGRVAPAATILDPASKITIPIPVPNISALGAPLGAVVPPPHRHRRLPGAAKLTAVQAAGALLAEAGRSAEAMTGRGTLEVGPSQRRLRPGDVIEVRGAAEPYAGLYAVDRVHDTLTAECHRQEFELVRAGLGAADGGRP